MAPRVKLEWDFGRSAHRDVLGQQRVCTTFEVVHGQSASGGKRRDLTAGVNARIGAPGKGQSD
jgi:hypothetical protein